MVRACTVWGLALVLPFVVQGAAMGLSDRDSHAARASSQAEQAGPPGASNFTRVDATVACGGATEPEAFRILAAEGFRSVINLRLPSEPGVAEEAAVVEGAGLRYIHLPLDGKAPDPEVAEQFLEVIADPTLAPVYIHCASANRVGAMWAIKRVVHDGWTRERALEEAATIGLTSPTLVEYVHRVLDARAR
jgi:uncharacterized protein (TIGR01244 family)